MRTVLAAVTAVSCSLAHASPPGMSPVAQPAAPERSDLVRPYHEQTLLADGLALGLVVLSATSDDTSRAEGFATLALGTYLLGAPLVHLTKGRARHAGVSLGLRVALPAIGMVIGHSVSSRTDCDPEWLDCSDISHGAEVGLLIGLAAAIAHDSIFLADGDDEPEPQPRAMPALRPLQGGGTLGVQGRF